MEIDALKLPCNFVIDSQNHPDLFYHYNYHYDYSFYDDNAHILKTLFSNVFRYVPHSYRHVKGPVTQVISMIMRRNHFEYLKQIIVQKNLKNSDEKRIKVNELNTQKTFKSNLINTAYFLFPGFTSNPSLCLIHSSETLGHME